MNLFGMVQMHVLVLLWRVAFHKNEKWRVLGVVKWSDGESWQRHVCNALLHDLLINTLTELLTVAANILLLMLYHCAKKCDNPIIFHPHLHTRWPVSCFYHSISIILQPAYSQRASFSLQRGDCLTSVYFSCWPRAASPRSPKRSH